MIKSWISAKAQTVLPVAVRQHLGVCPGDEIIYEITGPGEVTVRRAFAAAGEDPFALFVEWSTEADEQAYAGLPIADSPR